MWLVRTPTTGKIIKNFSKMEKEITTDLIQKIVESVFGENWSFAPFPQTFLSLYNTTSPQKRNLYLRIELFEGPNLVNYVENIIEIDFEYEGGLDAQLRREISKMKVGMTNS